MTDCTCTNYCRAAQGTIMPGTCRGLKGSRTSNERCKHGISLTANPPCHFCDYEQYVAWVTPQLERLGREMVANDRLRAALGHIKGRAKILDSATLLDIIRVVDEALSGERGAPETTAKPERCRLYVPYGNGNTDCRNCGEPMMQCSAILGGFAPDQPQNGKLTSSENGFGK